MIIDYEPNKNCQNIRGFLWSLSDVIAWMPLPKQYQEKNNG